MENLMKKVHNRKGFTLIELIIVIVIIAILAAIAIPAVSKYVGDAREAQQQGNLAVVKSAAGAAAAYATTSGSISASTFNAEIEAVLGDGSSSAGTSNEFTVILPKNAGTYKVTVQTSGAIKIEDKTK